MNIQKMMQQAQQMQERMQKQMAETVIDATAGGGLVSVTVNGSKHLLAITIAPEAVNKDDVDMLPDAILAAVQDAQRQADDKMNSTMSGMLGGLKLPGM